MTDDSELIVTQRGVSDRYPLHALVLVCRRQFSNVLFPLQQPSIETLLLKKHTLLHRNVCAPLIILLNVCLIKDCA